MRQHIGLLLFLLGVLLVACSTPAPGAESARTTVSTTPTGIPATIAVDQGTTPTTAAYSQAPSDESSEDPNYTRRQSMMYTAIIGGGIQDRTVIDALGTVPRHIFVPAEYQDQAYANHPLPIGYGQTISQPYIVALMTEAAEVSVGDNVLEIGTGSGYQAAVLAEIVDQVYSIEIIGALVEQAQANLQQAGYENIQVRHADGYFGWEEQAPFDAIIVTAAPDHVPQPLVQQLKIGGHLIIPVGPVGGVQTLWRVTRTSEDEATTENLGSVRFVPFTREAREE